MKGNLEVYKVFYQVAVCQGITAAAEQLCVSQPAVSQALRQMEQEAGCLLFVRTPRGVRLTKEGSLLFDYVKKGMEAFEEGESVLSKMLNLETGEIRIGASDMTLQFFLLPFLEKYHRQYPGIKIMVSNAPTPETICSLEEGKIDFGIVSTPFDASQNVEAVKVREIANLFVAGDRFDDLKGKILDYSCLKDLPCVFLEKNTSTRRFMDEFLEEKGIFLEPEFELATSDMVVQFAKRNMGVGCVMGDFAKEDLRTGKLFQLNFNEKMPSRFICVVSGKKGILSAAGKKLMDMLTGSKIDVP